MNKKVEVLRKSSISPWLTIRLQDGAHTWYAQGQVFDAPSKYGIGARDGEGNWLPGVDETHLPDSARISRLTITDSAKDWNHGPAAYNYDRGLDYDNTPTGLLQIVIDAMLKVSK